MNQPTESKTILEWFEEARAAGHEWADAAIENAWEAGTAEETYYSLRAALRGAFIWDKTMQGDKFWAGAFYPLGQNP